MIVAAPAQQVGILGAHLADDGRVSFMDTTALGRSPGRLIPVWQDWIARQAETGAVHAESASRAGPRADRPTRARPGTRKG